MKVLSRLKKLKPGRIIGGALGLLLVLTLIVAPAPPALAFPQLAHRFDGSVTISGEPAPEVEVSATIAGVDEVFTATTDAGGAYHLLYVLGDDLEELGKTGGVNGDEIEFSVDDVYVTSYTFESGASDTLNLTITVVDTTAPTVTITALTPDPTNVNTPTFTGTATDTESNINLVEYRVDDGEWTAADASDGAFGELSEDYTFTTATLFDGTYTVYVRATDGATNTTVEADYATDEFSVDTVTPAVLSTTPEADTTGVVIDAVVSATFDEDIHEGDNFGTIDISGATGISASIVGDTLTIAHDAFAYETPYEVTIPAGAVNDLADNPLAEAKVWSFTTITEIGVTYDLTVYSTDGGEVTIPGEGVQGPYDPEAEVPLLAEPDEGYEFISWTGDTGDIAGVNDASTTITMNTNYSITANFALIGATYNLTVASTEGGSVTIPGQGVQGPYDAGFEVTLLAVPLTDYEFVNWTGDTGNIGDVNDASTTIAMNADYSITANFAEVPGDLGELVDEIEPGGTLALGAGTYIGNITIDEPITITGIEGETIISGGIHVAPLTGSNVTIENVTIIDYTEYGIWIELVGADDVFTIRYNTIDGAEGDVIGIQVDEVEADGILDIEQNSISGNVTGIRLLADVAAGVINFNNIVDNEVGLELLRVDHQVGASRNWWGDISGPEEGTWNPSGIGDKIELPGSLDYYPWLTREFQTVLDDNIAYFGMPMVWLYAGWNIMSTPIALDPLVEWVDSEGTSRTGVNTWGDYIALGDRLDIHDTSPAWRFDSQTQLWAALTDDSSLKPCDAIYVRMDSDDKAAILYSPTHSVPSTDLYSGWNLISLAWLDPEVYGMPANEALVTVEQVTGGLTGYKLVVCPSVNADESPWIYIAGDDPSLPDDFMWIASGYWVFMLNEGTLAGFTFTPISLTLW